MYNDIPKVLRRKKTKKEFPWLILSILFFLFSLAFAADQLGFTNVAKAEEPPMTEKEVCQKMKGGFPVSTDGVNDQELKYICKSYGVTLKEIKHYNYGK